MLFYDSAKSACLGKIWFFSSGPKGFFEGFFDNQYFLKETIYINVQLEWLSIMVINDTDWVSIVYKQFISSIFCM